VTKYRRKVFTKKSLQDLREIFEDICHKMGLELIEFEGERDHVHLLVHYLPTQSISKLVNALKGASSRRVRKMGYEQINKALWGKSLWSPSYFAGSCGGASIEVIRTYIENQKSPT
jgi:putative transposase